MSVLVAIKSIGRTLAVSSPGMRTGLIITDTADGANSGGPIRLRSWDVFIVGGSAETIGLPHANFKIGCPVAREAKIGVPAGSRDSIQYSRPLRQTHATR